MRLNIIQQRQLWWKISSALAAISILAMIGSWLTLGSPVRLGLDFAGGTLLQLERDCSNPTVCATPLEAGAIRSILDEQDLGSSSVQVVGDAQQAMTIRARSLNVEERTQLEASLNSAFGPFDIQKSKIDTVGPAIGERLLVAGLLSLVISFLGIVIYLTLRFQLDYAVLAMVALFHDVFITVGSFSILGLVMHLEVDSLFLVALLTITGFSVNDTVVIYDRIRETLQLHPDRSIQAIVDDAVNQTLTRSINTTLTVMLPLFSIFFLGGETLKTFALALIIGFALGAYSSIFVASSLLSWWRERRQPPASLGDMVTPQEALEP